MKKQSLRRVIIRRRRVNVYQINLPLCLEDGRSAPVFDKAKKIILKWVMKSAKRQAIKIPRDFNEDAFSIIKSHGQLHGAGIEEAGVLAVRVQHDDRQFPDDLWIVDIALLLHEGGVQFGLRLGRLVPKDRRVKLVDSTPGVVKQIAKTIGFWDGRAARGKPWFINTSSDLRSIDDLLMSRGRALKDLVLTEVTVPVVDSIHRYLLNPNKVAESLIGIANVICVPEKLFPLWQRRWEHFPTDGDLMILNGGRVIEQASVSDVLATYSRGERGVSVFKRRMVKDFYEIARRTPFEPYPLRFIDSIRSDQRLHSVEMMSDKDEIISLYEAEVEDLKERLDRAEEEVLEQVIQVEDLASKLRESHATAEAHEREVRRLRYLLEQSEKKEDAEKRIPIPKTYAEMGDWVKKHFAGRLVLLPRAERMVKASNWPDIDLVYKCLILLATTYREGRLSGSGTKGTSHAKFEERLKQLDAGMWYTHNDSASRNFPDYRVKWPLGSNENRLLKSHLKKGGSPDTSKHLRIYFFWCDKSEVVVVGALTKHLTNTKTN